MKMKAGLKDHAAMGSEEKTGFRVGWTHSTYQICLDT